MYQMARTLSGLPHDTEVHTTGGRVFLVTFALYGRLMFVSIVAIVLAPTLHRVLHALHLEANDDK